MWHWPCRVMGVTWAVCTDGAYSFGDMGSTGLACNLGSTVMNVT